MCCPEQVSENDEYTDSISNNLLNPLLHRYSLDASITDSFLKTLWKKKKLLIMSNFFFSHNVLYSEYCMAICPFF